MVESKTRSDIHSAAERLKAGKCVAMPTETVYGLAARFDSHEGIASIFRLKERPSFDPLIVHIESSEQVRLLAEVWSKAADSLAKAFWPGPLTLVVPKRSVVSSMITSGLETVGIRMPKHPLALELIRAAGAPLAAPSANRFGRTSPTTADHVRIEFPVEVAAGEIMVLDGGESLVGVESTVCLVEETEIKILRPGGITIEELRRHFEKNQDPDLRDIQVGEVENHKASPGHTKHHYETKKPLIVSWGPPLDKTRPTYTIEGREIATSRIHELKLSDEPALAARMLYGALREADTKENTDALFIHRDLARHNGGLWVAIDDRLKRASRLQLETKR